MHAYIVSGGSPDDWIGKMLKDRSVSPHDTITIAPDGPSVGIEMIRPIAPLLSIHPVAGTRRAVLVRQAHAMTIEAQNAFLKTLEEPPGDALIILQTDQPDALLPTILSRCQLVRLAPTAVDGDDDAILLCSKTLEQLRESSFGKRLQIIDTLAKTREDALTFVNLAIRALHPNLQTNGVAKLLRNLLATRTRIMGNINPRLVLDAAFSN